MRLSLLAVTVTAAPLAAQVPARDTVPAPAVTAPAAPAAPRQAGATATLSLQEAVSLARRNNPTHLSALNDRNVAASQLRSAYGAFLPAFDASFGSSWREGRQQLAFGQQFGATSDLISSSYDIGLTARYDLTTLITPKLRRANVRAADAAAVGSESRLDATVTQQYLTVLQQQALAALQDTLLATARAQLALAEARAQVGAVTPLDVRRAEVAVGQQEVALLQARNNTEIEKVRLFQQMGVTQPPNVSLTSQFAVTDPGLKLEDLLTTARRANPTLQATRSREQVASLGYRNATAAYTPSLVIQSGIGGYTNQYTDNGFVLGQALGSKQQQCLGNAPDAASAAACENVTLTASEAAAARSANRQYPFSFQRNPYQVSAQLSIPIFNGFQREQAVQEATANRNDARYNVRLQELALTSDVTAAYLNLTTLRQTVAINERNAATARQALALAQERYRVGLNTFIDVSQARSDVERAENQRIASVYDYHKAYATLESAVGRPLR